MVFTMDDEQRAVFARALEVMSDFRRVFGKGLDAGTIAEMYVAHHFNLSLTESVIQQGYDAISPSGERYQIKYRADKTQLVLLNNFDFDYLVLVNLDVNHQLSGMWLLTVEQAVELFYEYRGKHRATHKQVKRVGERIV
jgi:hypothetical protein